MKRLLLLLLACLMLLLLTGCGKDYQEAITHNTPDIGRGYFNTIKQWGGIDSDWYYIIYANDTKVMYLIITGGHRLGITPLYNADGTLQVYSE